jgi:signal transduction histidine kinase
LRAGKGLTLVRQDIVPIVREVVSSYEDRPPGVQLVLEGVSDLVIAADAEQLRTVIRNLLENAVKYSLPDSHSICVTISRNGGAVLEVSDDGAGIPSEDAERIFEPFFRVDRSRSKESGGYGLGLSICKRVMEAHGGTIALDRKNERGTTMVLRFPPSI